MIVFGPGRTGLTIFKEESGLPRMSERVSLSAAYVIPVNEALAYRELSSLGVRQSPESRIVTVRTEEAFQNYLSGKVPEQGSLPVELIHRMLF